MPRRIGASGRPAKNLTEKIAALKERKTRHEGMLEELEHTGQSQVSLTDPDSRAMAAYPKVGVGYNAQVAFDAKHKLIVEQHVTNAGSDLGLLAPTAGAAKQVLGVERIDAVADRGYYKGEDIQACEDAGIEAYVARPQRGSAVRDGFVSQGRVPLRPDQRHLSLPRRTAAPPALPLRQGGPHDGAVLQSRCLPGL